MWSSIGHPNIVRLVDVFTAMDEGQQLTYVVQAYHPNAMTLEQAYLLQRQPVTEEVLWSHILQMLSAIHAVHQAGLAVRTIDISRVLVTGKESVRFSAAGLLDLTRPDASRSPQQVPRWTVCSHVHSRIRVNCRVHATLSPTCGTCPIGETRDILSSRY